jgi:hypothetical protein
MEPIGFVERCSLSWQELLPPTTPCKPLDNGTDATLPSTPAGFAYTAR